MSTNNDQSNEMNNLMEEIEKTMVRLHSGDIVKGHVINVTQDEVVVNLGYKSDGIIPRDEVTSEVAADMPGHFAVGDEIEVCVLQVDDGDGNVLLSRKKVDAMQEWVDLTEAMEKEESIEVVMKEVVRGGMIAYYKNVKCFIPASQLSDRYVDDLSVFVGQKANVRILEMDRRRSKIILSRKAVIMVEKEQKKKELLATLEKGQIVKGQVKQITNFGAFVDIGGIDGLIHISELSWGRVKHPSDVLSIGEEVEVEVLDFEESSERISLSLKSTQPEPWKVAGEKYQVGEVIEGEVVRLVDFGAFVEIEPGLDGLVHISQISEAHVAKPSDVLQKGQKVQVKILDINVTDQRMSLSMAAIEKDKKEAEEAEQPAEEKVSATEDQPVTIGDAVGAAFLLKEEAEKAAEVKEEAVEEAVEVKEEAVEEAAEVKEEAVEEAAEVKEEAVEEAAEVKEEAVEEAAEVKEEAVEEAAEVKEEVVEEVKAAEEEVEVAAAEKVEEAAEVKEEVVEEVEAAEEEVEETAAEKIEAVTDEVEEKAAEKIEEAVEVKEKAAKKAAETKEDVVEKVNAVTDEVEEKAAEEEEEEKA
jgi:small subunit ribosomal protein S1